jgi:hypothetical protein
MPQLELVALWRPRRQTLPIWRHDERRTSSVLCKKRIPNAALHAAAARPDVEYRHIAAVINCLEQQRQAIGVRRRFDLQ